MQHSNDALLRARAAHNRRAALAEAIRSARTGMSQTELGQLVGRPQATISTWETGKVLPDLEMVVAIELATGLAAGHLLKAAGYVDLVPGEDAA